jgi:carboxyl-terminal processing protease
MLGMAAPLLVLGVMAWLVRDPYAATQLTRRPNGRLPVRAQPKLGGMDSEPNERTSAPPAPAPRVAVTRTGVLAAVAVVLALVAGIWWGGHPGDLPSPLRDSLVANPHESPVDAALADIEQQYYRRLGAAQLQNGAISGAVATLGDPYASYETPAEYRDFGKAPAAPRFSGIGVVVIPVARGLRVEQVIPGSPASHGGIKAGDVITGADGRSFAGRSATFSESVIRGKTGTDVSVTIARGTLRLELRLRRALVSEPAVPLVTATLRVVGGVKIGVIGLATFDVSGIHEVVAARLTELLHRGARAIVLDLRDNGGGLVSEAQAIASLFIAHGVIVTTRGRAQPTQTLYATGHPLDARQPMAVLVNGYTASAAEIVTGALQDDHRATVVGTHTYGKGVYQEVLALPGGGAIKITVGEYFLPDGRNLGAGGVRRGYGIRPNVVVTAQPSAHGDPALRTALRLLAARAR